MHSTWGSKGTTFVFKVPSTAYGNLTTLQEKPVPTPSQQSLVPSTSAEPSPHIQVQSIDYRPGVHVHINVEQMNLISGPTTNVHVACSTYV